MSMRRLFALAVLSIAPIRVVTAQGSSDHTMFGLYGGLNLATIEGGDIKNSSYQADYLAGISVRWNLGIIGFQPALEYSRKGVTTSTTSGTTKTTVHIHLNYVELPLLLRVGSKPFLLVGPSVAVKTSCDAKAESGGVSLSGRCSDFAKIESLDYGAMAGVGTDFNAGSVTFSLAARYDLGLKKLASDSDAKNRAISVVFGVSW